MLAFNGENLDIYFTLMMSLNRYCHVFVVVEQSAVRLRQFMAGNSRGQTEMIGIVIEKLDE